MYAWIPSASVFLLAFVVSQLVTPIARKIAVRLDAVDYPSSRRMNATPVPRMGGIAILCSLLAAGLLHLYGTSHLGWPSVFVGSPSMDINYFGLALACFVVFITGLIDDVHPLSALPKLIGQTISGIIAATSGLVISNVINPFGGGELHLGWLGFPLTVLYLVCFANVINLIDGLDGLASGVTCISSLTMFILAFNAARLDASIFAIVLCGATLGFLRYNFNPATIFLGDSGALLLGFSLGMVSLMSMTRVAGLTTLLLPLVLAGIPILDTFFAIVRRKRANVSIGDADKGHIHHRLIQEGYNQRQAVVLIYMWTCALCVGAIVMSLVPLWPRVFVFVFLAIFSFVFAFKLKLFKPVLLHRMKEDDK